MLSDDRSAIVCATGDSVEDASGRKTSAPLSASILIATYEKFLGCLSTGGPPRDLKGTTFVCDEVQLIGDKKRGQNTELLLTLMHKAGWHQFVGLSAVLSEPDAQSFADWLGLRLVRNPTREKALTIECRSPDVVSAITFSPGVDGAIVNIPKSGSMRTIRGIVTELLAEPAHTPVIVFCMKVDDTYDLAKSHASTISPTKQVTTPPGFELDIELRGHLERGVAYHNAELSEEERLFVEDRLAKGKINTVYATSTLAAGVNFPLGSAVFSKWTRWNSDRKVHEPIGRAEFQNMAGRVGRMGQSGKDGRVVLVADGGASLIQAQKLMDFGGQDDLGLGISPKDFGVLTLQLFAGRLCSTREEAFDLISSTLSALRELDKNLSGIDHWEAALNIQIDRLIGVGCLIENALSVSVTSFGIAVAKTGLKPETAIYFIEGLLKSGGNYVDLLPTGVAAGDGTDEDDLLFIFAHAALSSPEYGLTGGPQNRFISWRVSQPNLVDNPYARRLDALLLNRPWAGNVLSANAALMLTSWAAGKSRAEVEKVLKTVKLGTIQAIGRDAAWVLTGVSEIISAVTSPILADEAKPPPLRGNSPAIVSVRQLSRTLRRLATRINVGLPSDILWMTALDLQQQPRRLSRSQMLALRVNGLIRPVDLMDGSPDADEARKIALNLTSNLTLGNQVRDAARTWKIGDRAYWQRVHTKRAQALGAESLVGQLYDAKGDSLETAFADAMAVIGVQCQRLDTRN